MMIDCTPKTFNNLTNHEKDGFLDYKLMIYVCKGNDKEKLDWFKHYLRRMENRFGFHQKVTHS